MQQRQKLDELCNGMNNLFVAHNNLIGISQKSSHTKWKAKAKSRMTVSNVTAMFISKLTLEKVRKSRYYRYDFRAV
jgi:hypothetical protein